MSKNKNMYGVICKSIHKGQHRRDGGDYPSIKFPIRSGVVNFLFFQIFICLAVLMMSPNVWAALTSMSVDASGDNIFRGGSDRLLITFTVDDRTLEEGDSYTVTADGRLIAQGTVLENETVRIFWDGSINGQQLPDGPYEIKVVLNKPGDDAAGVLERMATAILDATPPRISDIFMNDTQTLLITEGSFIKETLRSITVTPDKGVGSEIDFGRNLSNIVLQDDQGTTLGGSLSYTDTTLTFTLSNPLDISPENGIYTLQIRLSDKARNTLRSEIKFAFDNVAPRLTNVATSRGRLTPGAGVNQQVSYVEATLSDNFADSLDLFASRIRLTGPNGAVLGQQTQPSTNRIRWQLLSPLSAAAGLQDGEYTIEIVGVDKAGNRPDEPIQVSFFYDNLAPELVSLSPAEGGEMFNLVGDTVYSNLPITQFVATFNDDDPNVEGEQGVGVSLVSGRGISSIVFGTPGENGINALAGKSFPGADGNALIHVLNKPIVSRDGSQDGRYILNVQATDLLGNTKTYNYRFIYDTQLPTLISTVPAANETVSELSQVEIKLNEKTSGIDFIQSSFQLTRDVGGEQVDMPVPVNITSNGTNTITLTLTEPIALDGSDDGTYRIEITPTDRAGNSGTTAVREFYLISQKHEPEIRLTMPETTTVNSLTTIATDIVDYIGAGIDFDASTLTVRNSQGALIAQEDLVRDEASNLLTWTAAAPVARDGSADGEYTITATFIDFTGRSFTQEFPILLDTQFPAIENVQVAAESATLLAEDRTTDIADSVGQIVVAFDETASDVDFGATVVSLMGPGETAIPVNRVDDGQAVLTLNFQALTQRGEYILSITPQDLAGNQSAAPFVYRFRIDVALPVVSSVLIDGKSGTLVYVNGSAANIIATFADLSGVGLALGEGGSTITVTNPSGIPAPGITTSNGTNQLTWTPIVLPTDGSADGRYTVAITPIDNAGRQGDVVYRQFVYDTQEPRITAATPLMLTEPVSYVGGGLNQLTFTVADVVPGEGIEPSDILWESQTIELLDASGTAVPTALTYDELASQLYLTLSSPFAQDGSADGEYTVKLGIVDRSGNLLDAEYTFIYDSQVPSLSSVRVNTEPPMALVPNRITEILESASNITFEFEEATRVDFANTQVTLTGPTGETIPLTLEDNGTTGLTASFLPLVQVGMYTLSVTAQDVAGNVAPGAVDYRFTLDLALPLVSSVLVDGKAGTIVYVNGTAANIVATFADLSGVGVALGDSGSTIAVTSPSGIPAPGITTATGENQLTWSPIVLPTDGSADGRYTVTVTPIDNAGRQGDVIYRQFVYDTQEPRITAATSLTLNAPVSYVSGGLSQFTFTIEDVIPGEGIEPSDILWESQTIALLDASGNTVPTALTFDELSSQLYLTLLSPFAQDGSVDGEYTVKLGIVDKAGNRLDVEHAFIYDSQVPGLSSVMINAESPVELVPQQVTEILETPNAITLQFEEATRVDFANTVVTLAGPDDQPIPLNVSVDGFLQLTVRFIELTQAGLYTLSVTPQDIAGNVAQGAVQYTFRLELVLPSVSAVTLGGQMGDLVFLNGSDSTIVATLVDEIGVGLALGEDGSSIVVTNASGSVVPGQLRLEENELIWNPISLPTDGSVDGRYSVEITPVDKTGRRGEVVSREFIYDTEAPQITASSPLTLSQPVSYVSGDLSQFTFTVADVGPSDLVLADQTVILVDAAGDPVSSVVTHDELTNQLYLTLSSPFAQDGSVDGEYTVELGIVDKAGNRLDSAHIFIYDSQVPNLSSVMVNTDPPVELVPNRIAEILASISSITLKFEEATRIDFANTQITLMGPDPSGATDDSGVPIESEFPLTFQDDGASQVTVNFLKLEQIGSYTLSITPRDVAGNTASGPVAYRFFLDIPLPRVTSIVIGESETTESGDVAYVNASNMIIGAFLVDPTETGLSFGTEGSSITVVDVNNTIVRGVAGSNGEDLIVWEPIGLTSDGTTDGRYSVYVIPVDQAGRQGSTIYREFVYDTQEPEITAADPVNLSQPVSYISRSLTQLRFTVADVGPADLMLSDQQVSLRNASGSLVPAQLTNDTENQLFLTLDQPLPLDGSMDGEYTVLITLADKAGNSYTVEHSIIYDTQAPTLVSTVPADGALLTEDVTEIQVTLNDEGGSRIDWAMTTVSLVDPNGTQISGELVSDGATKLTLTTNQLVADGRYIIRVQAVDRAGNGNTTVFERNFLLSRRLPTVVSTEPTTAPKDEAFTNEELERIEVRLETDDENHLSTLRLLNNVEQVVAGQQRRTSTRLIYDLVRPLATDGSEDGVYTIEFTPISASGRSGGVQRFTFTYDTQSPEIETDEVISLVVVQSEVNNSLTEIRVNLTDETSGIDWKNLDEKWLTFERLSPNPTKISGRVSDDGQGNLTFRLTVPLADNGSADGEYKITINPKDRAGNDDEPYQKVFVYDTNPPTIDESTLLINELPLLVDINAADYPTAVSTTGGVVIQANIFDTGLGVNLAQSRITVRSPDGSEISGSTQQNGVDTLIFKSDGLTLQGVYKITVISVGNDSELLGFAPTDSITAEFLYETTEPTAAITSDGGETELTDKALPLEGTASDPAGTQRVGEGEIPVPASGVWLVEIVGTGPDKQPIEPVAAVDDSDAEQEPWSVWSIDFLPTRSGEYDLDVRVTDNAGNYAIYDIGTYTMSVSLTFRGTTFGWPNPLRLSKRDVAFFSFDVNVPLGDTIELTLSIYDWSGDMVLSQTYPDVVSGQRNDQLVKWNLENQAGTPVARGLYIFRLEAVNAAGNRANVVGKVLVVE